MKKLALILVLGTMLSACGGGDDDAPAPAPTASVPASASESIGGFISYLKALVVSSADPLEPVDVSAVTPPVSETSEPETVD